MTTLDQRIREARRRLVLRTILELVGWILSSFIFIELLLLILRRGVAVEIPMGVDTLAVIGAVLACLKLKKSLKYHYTDTQIAVLIDQRLALKDQLSSAIYAIKNQQHPFSKKVIEDAVQLAQKINLRQKFPISLTRIWAYLPVFIIFWLSLFLWVPQMDWVGLSDARTQKKEAKFYTKQTRKKIKQVLAEVEKIKNKTLVNKSEQQKKLSDTAKALQALSKMDDQEIAKPRNLQHATTELSDLNEKLEHVASEKEAELQAMQNATTQIQNTTAGPADQLAKAFRQGDFVQAQQQLNDLSQRVDTMSQTQQKTFAKQIREMAQQFEQIKQSQIEQQKKAESNERKILEKAGANPQAAPVNKSSTANYPKREDQLKQVGQSVTEASKVASEIQKQEKAKKQAKRAEKVAEKISHALNQAADEIQKQNKNEQEGSSSNTKQAEQSTQQKRQIKKGKQSSQNASPQANQPPPTQGSQSQSQQAKPQHLTDVKQSSRDKFHPSASASKPKSASSTSQTKSKSSSTSKAASKPSPAAQSLKAASKQLDELAKMQQQARQLRQSQSQVEQALRQMQSPSGKQGNSQSFGTKATRQVAALSYSHKRNTLSNATIDKKQLRSSWKGKAVGVLTEKGMAQKGKSTITYKQVTTAARQEAERAVAENRLPRRYHRLIQKYFEKVSTSSPAQTGGRSSP